MNMKGNICKVSPITSLDAIGAIEFVLKDNFRDLSLFLVGINTGFRASDLSLMRVGDFIGKRPGDALSIREKKTGKVRKVTLNASVIDVVDKVMTDNPDDYLFRSTPDNGPLCVETINRLVKKWCRKVGLLENYGSHTLRKTFGYHQRVTFGVDIPTLMEIYGHKTQVQTLEYLCIQPEEVHNAYMNEIRGGGHVRN